MCFFVSLGCRFINLQVSSLTDKWYGESQKLAAAVFSLVRIITFDLHLLTAVQAIVTKLCLNTACSFETLSDEVFYLYYSGQETSTLYHIY